MAARQIRWIVVAIVLAALAGTVAWLFAPRPIAVDVAQVARGPIVESVADQGAARVREAYVVAAPVSGRLRRIELHVGDKVEAGRTPIATIEPTADLLDPRTRSQAEAAVSAAQAAVRAASAQHDRLLAEAHRAEVSLERVRALVDRGFAAKQALDDAEATARAARAAVQAGAAEVGARRADVARTRAALLGPDAGDASAVTVTAPASGYVTRVLQESSRVVAMGSPLVEVGDQTGLEAAIEFLSQDAVRIQEGMPAEIFDWGGKGSIPAKVRRIEPQGFTKTSALGVDEQRVLVLLQFTGDSAAWAKLGPGYRVWGRVVLRQAAAVLKVPIGALVRSNGDWAVFRVVDGRARLTPVEVGALTEREAEIRRGLVGGQIVVVFPSDKVADGVRVEARPRRR